MENKNQYYEESFIARWIAGETSLDEQTKFDQWLKENPQEKKYFDDLVFIWEQSKRIHITKKLTERERWYSITENIQGLQPYKSTKARFSQLWKIASIAAIFVAILAAYYWTTNGKLINEMAARGEKKTLLLPCASEVTLNSESSIKYNKLNWEYKREIFLRGEAFFKITPGAEFTVKSDFVTTKVLGTSFNIKSRNNKVEVSCVTGRVRVESNLQNYKKILLTPSFKSVIYKDQAPQPPAPFNIKNKTSWLEGNYVFESVPLTEVFEEIERQFDCQIILKQNLGDLNYSGTIDKKSVEKSIEMVCLSAGLNYSSVGSSKYVIH